MFQRPQHVDIFALVAVNTECRSRTHAHETASSCELASVQIAKGEFMVVLFVFSPPAMDLLPWRSREGIALLLLVVCFFVSRGIGS